MFSVAYIISCTFFLAVSTNGQRYRTPCTGTGGAAFRCDNGECVYKHIWCNSYYDCNDKSDETHCRNNYKNPGPYPHGCKDDIHFKCSDDSMCIPREGVCDGYSSCPDMSDEKDCPCEEVIEDVGKFEYQAFLSLYRTYQKCWKIAVNSNQYLQLTVNVSLHNRDCSKGNLTISTTGPRIYSNGFFDYYEDTEDVIDSTLSKEMFCSNSKPGGTYEYFDNTLIRYSSNFYYSASSTISDLIQIKYTKADTLCKDKDSFKCSEISCISPQKQCDGHKDCENGLDEKDCEYGAFNADYLVNSRKKAIEWIKSQHNADWGWKGNTHKAVVALYLSQGANYNGSSREEELIAKQLELEVSTYLLRHQAEKMSPSELSAYINALLVICHDPRNFYGSNLIASLKEMLLEYAPPFSYLTLCNAEEHIPEDAVHFLLNLLENSPDHGFVLEIQAIATMALSCIVSKEKNYAHLQQNITEALNDLKKEQKEDGSFGNEYTTALVLQALKAGNQEHEKDWSPKSALQFVSERQKDNGSFGDFLTTYLVLPLLNAKTLVDVGRVSCRNTSRRPRDSDKVTDIKNKLGGKCIVKYSLYIGDDKDQIHPIIIRTPENITVHELMSLAVDIDPKYNFKTHEIKKKMYVYEVSNIPNDPLGNKFWFIYKGAENGTVPFFEQSPDRIRIKDQDHIIMWYKTLKSM